MTDERKDLLTMSGEELRHWWCVQQSGTPHLRDIGAFAALRDAILTAARQSDEVRKREIAKAAIDWMGAQPHSVSARDWDATRDRYLDREHPLPPRECVLSDGTRVWTDKDGQWFRGKTVAQWDEMGFSWPAMMNDTDTGADFDKLKSFAAGVGR